MVNFAISLCETAEVISRIYLPMFFWRISCLHLLEFNSHFFLFCFVLIIVLFILVCEQAYTMAQNLDPNSDGRGVLQFKTGLMSVIKVLSCL